MTRLRGIRGMGARPSARPCRTGGALHSLEDRVERVHRIRRRASRLGVRRERASGSRTARLAPKTYATGDEAVRLLSRARRPVAARLPLPGCYRCCWGCLSRRDGLMGGSTTAFAARYQHTTAPIRQDVAAGVSELLSAPPAVESTTGASTACDRLRRTAERRVTWWVARRLSCFLRRRIRDLNS